MTADDILKSLQAEGRTVILEGARVRIHPGIPPEEAERLRPYKPQIVTALRERDTLDKLSFTRGGKLCSRCRGLSRVAVVGGDLVCSYCIVGEAERLLR